MNITSFTNLSLKKELLTNLEELGFSSMTPIQSSSLPLILEGRDVIAQAKTGSGKTAAFGLGVLNSLDVKNTRVQCLILCPTRELVEQVASEVRRLARMLKNVKVLTITGGKSEYFQERSLAHGAHIVVGTPGRVLKLCKKNILKLNTANTLILDEADRMLDMGFHEDIMEISSFIPKERQTNLFSATFPDEIKNLGSKLQTDAIMVKVDSEHSVDVIEESFFLLDSHRDKDRALLKVLDVYRPERFIVFCKTKQITNDVADFLDENSIYAEAIHGDLVQEERTEVLTMFSNRSLSGLVATDVAARGLDIKDLGLVINFDIPSQPEIYTHRIGRTARAGKTGLAISFYTERETYKIDAISELQNKKIVPSLIDDLAESKNYDLIPEMTTIYISGGKRDKLRPGDIVGAIVGETGLDFKVIGEISISKITTFVAIKSENVDEVILKLNKGKIKNRNFKVGKV